MIHPFFLFTLDKKSLQIASETMKMVRMNIKEKWGILVLKRNYILLAPVVQRMDEALSFGQIAIHLHHQNVFSVPVDSAIHPLNNTVT